MRRQCWEGPAGSPLAAGGGRSEVSPNSLWPREIGVAASRPDGAFSNPPRVKSPLECLLSRELLQEGHNTEPGSASTPQRAPGAYGTKRIEVICLREAACGPGDAADQVRFRDQFSRRQKIGSDRRLPRGPVICGSSSPCIHAVTIPAFRRMRLF